jgi:hypothetical protein
MIVLGRRAEPDEIYKVENTECIDNEKGDEPLLLLMACGVPECEPFHDDSPEHEDDEKREKYAHEAERGVRSAVKRRRHWSVAVERIESVHIRRLYHTLLVCGISAWIMEVQR